MANALDCDDGDTSVNPGASEVPYDGIDNDCAGGDLADVDGDGHDALAAGGDDCDDADEDIAPGAEEVPYDGVDNDCDGADADDLDGDGSVAAAAGGNDCDDEDPEVYAGAEETWANGVTDNDCDGEIEGVTLEYGSEAWVGPAAGAQAGRRVGALGDINGDGLAEYLVGAVYESSEHAYGGAVYVVPGGEPAGKLSDATTLLPGGEYWFLPQVVEGGPDFSGDGIPDMVITATGAGDGGTAFLLSGADVADIGEALVDDLALASLEGDAAGDYAGTGAAFVGDVMGDGQQYVVVTALLADPSGLRDAGRAAAFGLDGVADAMISDGDLVVDGPYDDAAMGNQVMGAGDVDGDGIDDVLLSVNYGDLAYIVPGGIANPDLPADALFKLTGTGAGETGAVEMLGDIDGDGARDLACMPSLDEVRVFTALAATVSREVDDPSVTIQLGEGSLAYDLLDLGDIDGDGRDDTLVPLQWYPAMETSVAGVFLGADLGFRDSVDFDDTLLTAASLRIEGRFGYRVALSDDVDGDGGDDIILGGYSDVEGGTDAGAALTIPVPR